MSKRKTNEEFLKEVYDKNEYVRRGEIEILSEYVDSKTKIKCRCAKHDWIYWVAPSSLLNNIGCSKCGRERTTQKQMKSHEQFVAEVYDLDPTTTVLGTYAGAFTLIDFMCSKNHVYPMRPVDFLHGERCPYCSNRKVLIGYNDVATTRPDVAALFTNPEDGYKYTCKSQQSTSFTCPLCGTVQDKQIGLVSERGFSCKNCSDHLSYPNRFGRAFFDQLPVDYYDTEWQPDWAKPYYYDLHFEFNSKHYIVEWDGTFHFEEDEKFGTSLEERQERDRIKNELACQHNVHMIRINCIESKRDYIKKNIVQSELSDLFDLSNVDWKLCDEKAQKTLVKTTCDLYMSGMKSFKNICTTLHIGDSAARSYIKRGAVLGWCDYDPKKKNQDKIDRQSHPVVAVHLESNNTYKFYSVKECIRKVQDLFGIKIYGAYIANACKTGRPYKGFLLKYDSKTIQN